jgi:putative membrane protein
MYYWSLWGMGFFWWMFWIAAIAIFFALATPVRRGRGRLYDDPISILRRRYAAGEITTEEYEDRKSRLLKDMREEPSGSVRQPPRIDRHQPA